jgi:hypothetical protein
MDKKKKSGQDTIKEPPSAKGIFVKGVVVLLITFIFFVILGYLGFFNLPISPPAQCAFPAGFSCVVDKLYAQTGKLYLKIGQGTGHQIRINGVVCTQDISSDFLNKTFISYGYNKNVTMISGEATVISDPTDTTKPWINISCTDADGSIPQDTTVGARYSGRIYINYTELDTNITKFTVGILHGKYES